MNVLHTHIEMKGQELYKQNITDSLFRFSVYFFMQVIQLKIMCMYFFSAFFKIIFKINLFILLIFFFSCVGSSLWCAGFSLRWARLLWSPGSSCRGSVVVTHGQLQLAGSVVVEHGLSCSVACGIFLDQGSNPCPQDWQADSQPLHHQGSTCAFLKNRSLLEYNCYTILCQFLLYTKVNQPYAYLRPHIPSFLSLPPIFPIPPLQVIAKHRADLPVLSCCFPLAILHSVVYIC